MRCFALSLTQPWASLVIIGEKRFETRSFSRGYTGQLAIHASKNFPRECRELAMSDPFLPVLRKHGLDPHCLPLGAVLGKVELRAYHETTDIPNWDVHAAPHELDFGDYGPERFAWEMHEPMRLVTPIPAKGALGLWPFEFPVDAKWMDYRAIPVNVAQEAKEWRKHGVLSSEIEHDPEE